MFDFHMHTVVSFDGHDTGLDMALAAREKGLKAICFTDHMDYDPLVENQTMTFDFDDYRAQYDDLDVPGLKICRGMEFGLTVDNRPLLEACLRKRHFDFLLGSVHFADGVDVYYAPYWEGKSIFQAERVYLEQTLKCVQLHDNFDVLAHLSYVSKARAHPTNANLRYDDHRELLNEILRTLAQKGKGLEINTSGIDRCGGFLPDVSFFRRFKEFGGEIVTIGSDAHNCQRVGQYADRACAVLKDIFGHVCTFEGRKPIFHKL